MASGSKGFGAFFMDIAASSGAERRLTATPPVCDVVSAPFLFFQRKSIGCICLGGCRGGNTKPFGLQ
jgi:hypothetical protein